MFGRLEYKATVWFKIPIEDEETFNKVMQMMKDGLLPAELYNQGMLDDGKIQPCEILYDTEECMSPSQNKGHSTIEMIKDMPYTSIPDEIIWKNGK